ncbi:UDP-N-acetylmuramate--L-alanine ligase [Peredibacter starrii]|uniref:UDP-N-acetylmuramate--L-alanine ligase n=1 Tax=Peredibacter starrii TaxID=28202 RepID=A0AAX4HQS5_9BACT|nr:UDP-N-acetylmuramate--L-alanine ligase [Peredibacter starrii]WPU65478.1 UDP-N-acetylmuramate--L-alanine ligase [Peredibacter starrii]
MLGWLKATKLHFIGIGGIGMSGIAEVLLDLGYKVSGSDLNASAVTENLQKKGAEIFIGHKASNVEGSTLIVYSSAIDTKNPEVIRATELEIPMIRRAEMLAELMRLKFGIAVAGSHGKTTTTSLIATIFQEAKLDATHIIGGIVRNLGGNAKKGDGQYLIAEADESDGSFLLLNPIMAAVTNIDNDHLDHYGTEDKIVDAFVEFVNRLPFYGRVALNANDATSLSIKSRVKRPIIWYGIELERGEADYVAKNVELSAGGTQFDLYFKGEKLTRIQTNLMGMHNVSNTLAAISLSHEAGLDIKMIQQGLLSFQGVGRRLEKLHENKEFVVIDDYGHHPTEVRATISTLRRVDQRPLCVVFEPHRYTRTQNFWKEFQDCFEGCDELYLAPIYAASEKPIDGITSEAMAKEMKSKGKNVTFISSLDEMKGILEHRKNQNCVFVTLGAGAISKKIRELVKNL